MPIAHPDHYINHQWVQGTGSPFTSHNPATGDQVWQGNAAAMPEIQHAVQAARIAFKSWSKTPSEERIALLTKYGEILKSQGSALAEAISKEVGKPLWESKAEVNIMTNKVGVSIEAYQKRWAEATREYGGGLAITRHRPHGVIAIYGPFNFPGHIPNGQIVPALLAGNTIVLKPSEMTPLSSLELIRCLEKSGLPKGVVNMLQGGRDTGRALAESEIDGLFFTGSWETGRILSEQFAKTPDKILALELGGNNPLVIGNHADGKAAALMTIQSAFITAGQRCTCARRLIVIDSPSADAYLKTLTELTKQIRVGVYNETPEPFMGPVISRRAANHLLAAQTMLKAKGGQSLVDMKLIMPDTALLSPGLMDVTAIKHRLDEELFGPFLQIIRVKDLDAAIHEANNTSYGLISGFFGDSKEDYAKFYQQVQAGVVTWNTPLTGATGASAPFGGIKRSGNNRPSGYYTVDYCGYPVASVEVPELKQPAQLPPGIL